MCVFDPELVQQFTPPPNTKEEALFKQVNFESLEAAPKVCNLLDKVESQPPFRRIQTLQESLFKGIINNRIWQYSNYHENSVYAYGFDTNVTIRLAFM